VRFAGVGIVVEVVVDASRARFAWGVHEEHDAMIATIAAPTTTRRIDGIVQTWLVTATRTRAQRGMR
jgi:hypothetical protein